MALSNIGREPRREITESVVGAICFTGFMVALGFAVYGVLWGVATMLRTDMLTAFLVTVSGGLVLAGFIAITHAVGEDVCDALDEHGIRLRPRRPNH